MAVPLWVWVAITVGLLVTIGICVVVIVFLLAVFKPRQGSVLMDMRRIFVDKVVTIKKLYKDPVSKEYKFNSNKEGEVQLKESSWTKNIPIPVEKNDLLEIKDTDGNNIVIAGWMNYIEESWKNKQNILETKYHGLQNQYGDLYYQYDLAIAQNINNATEEYLKRLAKLHNAIITFPPKPPGKK